MDNILILFEVNINKVNLFVPESAEVKSNIPRSESEGGLWARFKRSAASRCSTMTRSQTQEAISSAQSDTEQPTEQSQPKNS